MCVCVREWGGVKRVELHFLSSFLRQNKSVAALCFFFLSRISFHFQHTRAHLVCGFESLFGVPLYVRPLVHRLDAKRTPLLGTFWSKVCSCSSSSSSHPASSRACHTNPPVVGCFIAVPDANLPEGTQNHPPRHR